MKKHTVSYFGKYSPPAYVSNGFIGFRIPKNAFEGVVGLLGGFTAVRHGSEVEGLSVIPAPALEFFCDGVKVEAKTVSQTYDFSCGEFVCNSQLEYKDQRIALEYMIFASRTSPTLMYCSLKATGDYSCTLKAQLRYEVEDSHQYTVGDFVYYEPKENHYDGKCMIYSSDKTTTCGVAYRFFGAFKNKLCQKKLSSSVDLIKDETLYIITSYVPGVMHNEPHNQAQRMLRSAEWNGMERIRNLNKEAWAKLWESRITIEGAKEEWQNVIDASYFYLMSSVSEFSCISVPPFGLSHPDAYEGHSFWDTESFMFMTPLFCAPEIARSMLEYRFKRVGAAENNARLNGYRGIQFPWQSGNSGCEVTTPFANQAAEHHVTLDIALAFDGFARLHNDDIFIREKAWPIISGVCRWIESRVTKTQRGYEIFHITGIDEEMDDVANDSYSNIMCAKILRSGNEYAMRMGYARQDKWLEMADNMYIPVREDGVLMQYEGMKDKELQPSTTLMSYFPYGYTGEEDRKTFEYYIEHGMENYCRYPMLSGFLGVIPAWLGDREKALKMYEMANLTFFCEPFYSCTEWSIPDEKDRIDPTRPMVTNFITARGSLLMGLIMGLTKICPWRENIDAPIEAWLGKDISLPEGWKKITIGKVYIRGKSYRVEAEQGAERANLIEII